MPSVQRFWSEKRSRKGVWKRTSLSNLPSLQTLAFGFELKVRRFLLLSAQRIFTAKLPPILGTQKNRPGSGAAILRYVETSISGNTYTGFLRSVSPPFR